ncbi:NPCBM/NEW2 domain-containing protein [Streptomyces sp. S07_1.15]|uniref:NPCBM/NEW2 domain-containing protein n=1 Tax=Streptomyces sp. S07_1.15 TaxID=2873925 RepID=UPI001D140134|nr:NPCBM/NEW2 domain-containing protein [Streptomyces sp. S07_1.15]MCC3653071.1 NPCBM/NEW2 domain-containing protein [Streptomyces sp. S07_1.15]
MGSEQPTGGPPPADADLLRRTADGDDTAFEEFFRRHAVAVRRHARDCCHDTDSADDLTTEAFARTLRGIRGGVRPDAPERIHLLTTVRRVAAEWSRTDKGERLRPGFAGFALLAEATGPGRPAGGAGMTGAAPAPGTAGLPGCADAPGTQGAPDFDDARSGSGAGGAGPAGPPAGAADRRAQADAGVRAMREAAHSEVVRAFRGLPAPWQTVLWHTLVEAESPESAARLLGMSPEAATALAHRARKGLEQACLRVRLADASAGGGDCARSAPLLAACAEGGPRARTVRGVRRHLAACARCRAAVRDAADAGVRLRMALPVAVLGPLAAGYPRHAAGAAPGRHPGDGAGTGRVVPETGGAPVRMGLAAGVAAATAAVLVVLAGGAGAPDSGPRAGRAPAPVAPGEPGPGSGAVGGPGPEAPGPAATPAQTRRERAGSGAPPGSAAGGSTGPAGSRGPARSGGTSPAPSSPGAVASPSGTTSSPPASASGSSPPSSAPVPSSPGPSVEPKPAPLAYDLGELAYDTHGDGTGPEVRSAESSWLWPRQGIMIGRELFPDGVTVQARSSVTVDLNRPCTAYSARVGLDDLRPVPGAALFSVYGDGALLWRSDVLRDGDAALPVQVPLAGVRTLRLVVEPYRRSPEALADWAGARISCR